MRILVRMIALLGGCASLAGIAAAAEPAAGGATEASAALACVHVYADSAGVSHFRDERLEFSPERAGAPAVHALGVGAGALLARLKTGTFEDWHTASQPVYLLVVQGISEVTTSDGVVRRFGPGALVLLDDATGKGHQTRVVGDVDHVALVIPAATR
jgi:hypothetical protein